MTIKFEYKCNNCEHDYIEQRGNDEPNPFFSVCHNCKIGTYVETNQVILSSEPERAPGPELIIEEPVVDVPVTE